MVGEKREKPREKPTQTPYRPPGNPHGVTETRTRDPSGGRRAPNRLRHEGAHVFYFNVLIYFNYLCSVLLIINLYFPNFPVIAFALNVSVNVEDCVLLNIIPL